MMNQEQIKAQEITSYFLNILNADDLTGEDEFYRMVNEVQYILNLN